MDVVRVPLLQGHLRSRRVEIVSAVLEVIQGFCPLRADRKVRSLQSIKHHYTRLLPVIPEVN